MPSLFGTDGIRGSVDGDLHPGLVRSVGLSLAAASREGSLGASVRVPSAGPRVVVGRDTRVSGPKIESVLVDGLSAGGAEALRGGVLPTAAVAYLVSELDADAGVVVSASHNPPGDNGLKIFGPGGWKLDPQAEERIEELVASAAGAETTAEPGPVTDLPDAAERYIGHLTSSTSADLRGMRVVVDCGEGAASVCAPEALRRLGVHVTPLNSSGDGSRINESGGALHPGVVAAAAREEGAIGITFDGDADRVLLSDENGRLVDGDAIIALLADRMRSEGTLEGDGIVVTVMANQALREWCRTHGIKVVETPVGDRHVLEGLRSNGYALGGEQSGHIVRLDQSTTGDGILVAIGLLEAVVSSGGGLKDLVPFEPFPQVLVNVSVSPRSDVVAAAGVQRAIEQAEGRLGSAGRVLVRPSGTEPLIRVMVECADEDLAAELAGRVAEAVRSAGGD